MPVPDIPVDWDAFMREFGIRLQRARHDAGLTQEEAAYASGLTRSHYQQLEKGRSRPGATANPSLRTVIALAETLAIPLADLVGEPPSRRAG